MEPVRKRGKRAEQKITKQDGRDEARTEKVYFEWEPRDGQMRLSHV